LRELTQIFPQYKIVSEENSQTDNLLAAKENEYFMIDPLDGTSSFIKKSDEFTVNIAFIKNKKAVFGSIYLPVQDILYYTD
jgi:3'(2'), 5'-bisphosphate nucleotidase